jgi:NAD(P)H-dependent FMN reductase
MTETTPTETPPTSTGTPADASAPALAIVVGSVRESRFGPVVAAWVAEQAAAHGGFGVDVIDLADYDIPLALPAASPKYAGDDYPRPAGLAGLTARLDAADAFVIVTPEYNHSFPASLKNLIDWHYTQWQAKPIGFVSYGGLSGGLRAVEQLRQVFAELHAITVRDSVSLHGPWSGLGEDGRPLDPAVLESAAKNMVDQLLWWGRALRTARAEHPYGM